MNESQTQPPEEGKEGQTLEARLVDLLLAKATGALEITEDKKRRVFFLREGALVFSHSNLKSESAERVAERSSELSAADVPRVQAALRLGAVLGAHNANVEWHAGKEPPRPLALSFPEILLEALAMGLDGDTLLQRILDFGTENPAVAESPRVAVDALSLPPRLGEWLGSLDGAQSVRDLLAFGPEDPDTCARALYVGCLYGAVTLEARAPRVVESGVGGAGGEVTFRPAFHRGNAPVDPEAPPAPEADADFSRLIADAVRERPDGPSPEEGKWRESPARSEAVVEPPVDLMPVIDPEAMAIHAQIERIEAGQNHFETLGMPWDSSLEDFRSAYFGIARALHPDRLAAQSEALRKQASTAFDKARAAWEEMKDEETRTVYIDRVVHGKKSEDELAMEKVQVILEAEGIFKRGMAAFNAGQIIKAHTSFEEAFKMLPEEPEFAAYYGYTLYRSNAGRSEETAEEGLGLLKQSLEKGKKMDGPWVLMGRIFRDKGDEDKARRCFVQALRVNASNSDAARELERMKRSKEKAGAPKGGFLSKLFKRKKETKES